MFQSSWWEITTHIISLAVAYALALPVGWDREKDARSADIARGPGLALFRPDPKPGYAIRFHDFERNKIVPGLDETPFSGTRLALLAAIVKVAVDVRGRTRRARRFALAGDATLTGSLEAKGHRRRSRQQDEGSRDR